MTTSQPGPNQGTHNEIDKAGKKAAQNQKRVPPTPRGGRTAVDPRRTGPSGAAETRQV